MGLLDRLHPEDRDEFETSLWKSVQDFAPWFLDFRINDTAGQIHWTHGNSTPQRHENGAVVWVELRPTVADRDGERAIYSTLMDITERKRADPTISCLPTWSCRAV